MNIIRRLLHRIKIFKRKQVNMEGRDRELVKKERKRIWYWILVGLNVLLPAVLVMLMLISAGKAVSDCIPSWGDERWWWQQANAAGVYGRPLGYWGYNGGKPQIGTFAAWGPAMVMPYGIFAAIFGWEYHSYIYANLLYLGIAIFLFIRMTKIGSLEMSVLLAANMFLVVKNYYLITAMAECIRYSMGIVAVAMLYDLLNREVHHTFYKYILAPVYLAYITQAYLILGIFFCGYIAVLLKDRKWPLLVKGGVFLACTLSYLYVSRKFLRLFCSPYLAGARKSFIEKIAVNLQGILAVYRADEPFFKWFLTTYLVITASVLLYVFWKWKRLDRKEKLWYLGVFFVLAGFLSGHIVFYNTTTWTFTRGLSVGMVLAVFALCLVREKKVICVFLCCSLAGVPTFYNISGTFINERRFTNAEWEYSIAHTKSVFSEVLSLEVHTDNPWNNTVTAYLASGLHVSLALPAGFSVNTNTYNSRYAVVGKEDENAAQEKILELEENGFCVMYADDWMTVLEKNLM